MANLFPALLQRGITVHCSLELNQLAGGAILQFNCLWGAEIRSSNVVLRNGVIPRNATSHIDCRPQPTLKLARFGIVHLEQAVSTFQMFISKETSPVFHSKVSKLLSRHVVDRLKLYQNLLASKDLNLQMIKLGLYQKDKALQPPVKLFYLIHPDIKIAEPLVDGHKGWSPSHGMFQHVVIDRPVPNVEPKGLLRDPASPICRFWDHISPVVKQVSQPVIPGGLWEWALASHVSKLLIPAVILLERVFERISIVNLADSTVSQRMEKVVILQGVKRRRVRCL